MAKKTHRKSKQTAGPSRFEKRDILSIGDFRTQDLETIFGVADALECFNVERTSCDVMKGMVLGTLFFEPSTRTRLSFETAMLRLGGMSSM